MDLEIIVNPKVNDDGEAVVQVRQSLLWLQSIYLLLPP